MDIGRRRCSSKAQPSSPPPPRKPTATEPEERPKEFDRASASMVTPVCTVNVAVAGPVPLGVTVPGLTLQAAFFGAPEQDRLTA